MVRPLVTDTTEELYSGLGPLVVGDETTGWTSLHVAEATTRRLHDVNVLVRDRDDRPGWSIILDPEVAPAEYLPWLAQLAGVEFSGSIPTEAEMRQQIVNREGQDRGTRAAMERAVKATLTGSKRVIIREREGDDPYALYVATYSSQTLVPAMTEMAALRQKPAGLWPFTFEVLTGATYDELDAAFGTYDDQDAALGTYDDQRGYVP